MAENEIVKSVQGTVIQRLPALEVPASGLLDDSVRPGTMLMNFAPTDEGAVGLLFLSEKPVDESIADMAGQEILLSHWVIKKLTIPDREEGKMIDVVQTILITPERRTHGAMSVGLLRAIDLLRAIYGDRPYDPPIAITIVESDVGRAGKMLFFVPSTKEAVKKPKAK